MKNVIFILLFAFVSTQSFSQVWSTIEYQAEELLDFTGGITNLYTDEHGNTFEYGMINDNKMFRCDICVKEGIFNYNGEYNSITNKIYNMVYGVFGFYDINNKLVKKYNGKFILVNNGEYNKCRPYKWEEINKYLETKTGYVKFILPIYSGNDLYLTVPCKNN